MPPGPKTIVLDFPDAFDDTQAFFATGAFTDTGSWQYVSRTSTEIPCPADAPPETFCARHAWTIELDGANGTISIELRFTSMTTLFLCVRRGVWRISGGTGPYSDLHGVGRVTGRLDRFDTGAFELTGFVV